MQHESIDKKQYFQVLKNDYSACRQIHFMRQKSKVIDKVQIFCNEIENLFPENIKEFHSGKEYKNRDVERYLGNKGIRHIFGIPYTPQQNGIAEQESRIMVEVARSMLYSKPELPLYLWGDYEAIYTATHILNRSRPSKEDFINFKTDFL